MKDKKLAMSKDDATKLVEYIREVLDDGAIPSLAICHRLGIAVTGDDFDAVVKAVEKHLTGKIGGLPRHNKTAGFGAAPDPMVGARWALDVDMQLSTGVSAKMSNDMHVHGTSETKEAWLKIARQRHEVTSIDYTIDSTGKLLARLVRGLVPG